MPGGSLLLFRVSRDSGLAGILASHAQRNGSILGDKGAIEKDGGSCEGTDEVRRIVSLLSVRWKSLDSASLALLYSPLNH